MAAINPLRCRGYYYDTETGLYYLQSRYYDPAICRFINADAYASTGQGILGNNMFAYCRNSPIFRVDAQGFEDFACNDNKDDDIVPGNNYGSLTSGNGNTTITVGGPHGRGAHISAIDAQMNKLLKSGKVSHIWGNRSLKTTGLDGTQRPYIIAKTWEGEYYAWEYASVSQTTGTYGYKMLLAKIETMNRANPQVQFTLVEWGY